MATGLENLWIYKLAEGLRTNKLNNYSDNYRNH